jgi:hypothetical protein
MVYSGAWEKLIHKKTRSRKSRDTVPLSYAYPDYILFFLINIILLLFQILRLPFVDEFLLLSSEFLSLAKNKFLFSAVRKSSFNLLKVGQGNFPSLPPADRSARINEPVSSQF